MSINSDVSVSSPWSNWSAPAADASQAVSIEGPESSPPEAAPPSITTDTVAIQSAGDVASYDLDAFAPQNNVSTAVIDQIKPDAREAYAALSPEDRAKFDTIYMALGSGEEGKTSGMSDNLSDELHWGDMTNKDSTGASLLDTLTAHLDRETVLPNTNTQDVLKAIVTTINHTDWTFQGENTTTCAAAATQVSMSFEQPAEYARIAAGLAFDGQVTLQTGKTMNLAADQLGQEHDGRNPVDAAVQDSFKAYASQFQPEEAGSDQDFGKGRFGARAQFGKGRFGMAAQFGKGRFGPSAQFGGNTSASDADGLTANQIANLVADVSGHATSAVDVTSDNRDAVVNGMKQWLDQGPYVPVGVIGHDDAGNPTHHMVTVNAIDEQNGTVTYSDSTPHERLTMPLDDFLKQMTLAVLPRWLAPQG